MEDLVLESFQVALSKEKPDSLLNRRHLSRLEMDELFAPLK